ncbi:MAG: outer membrane beta-barrel protein [Gemmatimonadota bacterium]
MSLVLLVGLGVRPAAAQNLADYDYENLGFRALGVNLTYVGASDTDDGLGFEVRSDLGFLGPGIRVVPRLGFWKESVNATEIQALEARIAELALLPPSAIDLGVIERSVAVLGVDFQWTSRRSSLAPYVGIGLDAYLLNDSGAAIEGTFLDDRVITAGLSAVAGLELALQGGWIVYGDVRGSLVTDANNVAVAGGFAYYFGGR